jgi:O-antigen ligase
VEPTLGKLPQRCLFSNRRHKLSTLPFPLQLVILLVVARPTIDALRTRTFDGVSATDGVGGVIILLTVLAFAHGDITVARDKAARTLAIYCYFAVTYGLVALFWSPVNALPVSALRLATILCVLAVFREAARMIGGAAIAAALCASAIIPIAVSLFQAGRGHGLEQSQFAPVEDRLSRVYGPFDHPNVLAIYCCLILSVGVAALLLHAPVCRRRVLVLIVSGAAVAILLSFTRSAWIAAPISVGVIAFAARRRAMPVAVLTLGGLAAFELAGSTIALRTSGFSSLQYRERLWAGLVHHMTPASSVLGVGLGQVDSLVVRTCQELGISQVSQVHSDYLHVYIETGVVGVILYFGSILLVMRATWRWSRDPRCGLVAKTLSLAAVGASVVVLVVSVTDNVFQELVLQLVYWGLVGGAFGAAEADRASPHSPGAERGASDAGHQCTSATAER